MSQLDHTHERAVAGAATVSPAGTPAPDGLGASLDGPATPLGGPATGAAARPAGRTWWPRTRWAAHLALLAGYLAAGIAVTWPRVTYLGGKLPATRDAGGYVWDFWWVARQLSHWSSPWSTRYLAAPIGSDLGFHTLMPLPGVLLAPVTLSLGPSASYNLLSVACPGLLCYAMYRAARLWLPTRLGAVAAGGLFGLSPILAWRSFYEINLALGALFLPMALEAAIRLRRQGRWRQAVTLGVVLGAAMLTDQESAVLAGLVCAFVLGPWLVRRPWADRLGQAALAGATALVAASPQLIPMLLQAGASIPASREGLLDVNYINSGAALGQLFAPSPKVADYGLATVSRYYYHGPTSMVIVTFGVMLTALALLGAAVAWRRRHTRPLLALWAGCAALSLGSALWIGRHPYVPAAEVVRGVRLSMIMPFTWFVQLPGLSTFREANRFTELGLLPAVLLAGAAVEWLRRHATLALYPALALAALEAGWSGNPGLGTIPTAQPALDRPIAAQHSHSIVVDLPFGIRGGLPVIGEGFPPASMVLATADGHPLADAFISRIPASTLRGIERQPFYAAVLNAEGSPHTTTAAEFAAAARNARRLDIGWVLLWETDTKLKAEYSKLERVLKLTGFRVAYRVGHTAVYRPGARPGRAASPSVASPRISPRSPVARPDRSSAVSPARILACRDCQVRHTRAAT
jgi:Dolichyl-phosphate-mannose-protein mannosyltransferase